MPFKMMILKVVFKFEGVFVLLSMTRVGWEESRCDCLVLSIAFFNDERNHLLLFPSLFQLLSRCVFMVWKLCISRSLGTSLLSLSYYETCNHKALLLKLEHLLHADFFCFTSSSLVSQPVLPTFCIVTCDKSCLFPIPQSGKSLPCLPIWIMFKRIRGEF